MSKNILVITTGGTIAMKYDENSGGNRPSIDGSELLSFLPKHFENVNIDIHDYGNKPSPHMKIGNYLEFVNIIKENQNKYDGFLITHGTDVLEEAAFFLDSVLPNQIPVVITAAMRSNNELGLDGPRNIVGALKTVLSPETTGMGVLVVLNDEIHDPLTVMKKYTSNVSTFHSPGFGILGFVDEDKVFIGRHKVKRHIIDTSKFENNIVLYKTYIGDTGEYLEFLKKRENLKGIIIEGFGRGNIPPQIRDNLLYFLKKDIPVIISTRCHLGRTLGVYSYKGSGKDLEDHGGILSKDLKPHKAYILLGLLIGKGYTIEKIRKIFNDY